MGDPLDGRADQLLADDWLGFAGVPPPSVRVYRVERHIAEKLHAYTMPRKTPNGRLKDLPDLALLGSVAHLELAELSAAIAETFQFRDTHEAPQALPDPPPEWERRYQQLISTEPLPWPDLETVTARARAFVEPALAFRGNPLRWDREGWRWAEIDASVLTQTPLAEG